MGNAPRSAAVRGPRRAAVSSSSTPSWALWAADVVGDRLSAYIDRSVTVEMGRLASSFDVCQWCDRLREPRPRARVGVSRRRRCASPGHFRREGCGPCVARWTAWPPFDPARLLRVGHRVCRGCRDGRHASRPDARTRPHHGPLLRDYQMTRSPTPDQPGGHAHRLTFLLRHRHIDGSSWRPVVLTVLTFALGATVLSTTATAACGACDPDYVDAGARPERALDRQPGDDRQMVPATHHPGDGGLRGRLTLDSWRPFRSSAGSSPSRGWRIAWSIVGLALVLGFAPLAWTLVRDTPETIGLTVDGDAADAGTRETGAGARATLGEALRSPAFWVFGVASAHVRPHRFRHRPVKRINAGSAGFPQPLPSGAGGHGHHRARRELRRGRLCGAPVSAARARGRAPDSRGGPAALPHITTVTQAIGQAVAMGIGGGFVMVVFFSFWTRAYGRPHLGRIQGAAQALTVLASAVGPLVSPTASNGPDYGFAFYLLSLAMKLHALYAAFVPHRPALSTPSGHSSDSAVSAGAPGQENGDPGWVLHPGPTCDVYTL